MPPRPQGNLSPDGRWRALIRHHNLAIEPASSHNDANAAIELSTDGSEHDAYCEPVHWSPDSRKLVCFRAKPVRDRQIHIVQSSPPDQLQPKLLTIHYPKPGDPISQPKPRLFDIASRKEIAIDETLFNNPYFTHFARVNFDGGGFTQLTAGAGQHQIEFSPDHQWIINATNSNVVNAAKLTGKLLPIVGEIDRNVDPASTAQVVAALEQAGKDFDFVPIMNSNHGAAESPYGKYRRADFLVRHLGGPLPPDP